MKPKIKADKEFAKWWKFWMSRIQASRSLGVHAPPGKKKINPHTQTESPGMGFQLQHPCIECPTCGVRYVMAEAAPSYGNGAVIEMFPSDDSDCRRLLCSCGHAYVFGSSAVKTYWISDAAYERGYDYDIVPTPGVEDYYDPPTATMSGLNKAA